MPDEKNVQTEEEVLTLNCRVITPTREIFNGAVTAVNAIGKVGELQIMPLHEPLLTPLRVSLMSLELPEGAEDITLAVHGGFLDMNGQEVSIYADSAEKGDEVDLERAHEAEKRARERLAAVTSHGGVGGAMDIDMDRAQLALMRAINRMQLADKVKAM